jgi:hypothetical protein
MKMSSDAIMGIVRAVLAGLGGYLVAKGVIDEGTLNTIIGAIITLITAVWSVASKRKTVELKPAQ